MARDAQAALERKVAMLQASTLSCSSVDGRVRRYDLRMGQVSSDYVGSECGPRGQWDSWGKRCDRQECPD